MTVQIPKGLFDILPYGTEQTWQLSNHWQYVENLIQLLTEEYSFQEIRTPVFERTELFQRGVGETSDIVSKEMYTFLDKADRSMSLRPEGTASLMRAFIEHHLVDFGNVHKFYYVGPMFRYERPQSGRYRQHHQFGAEAIGISSPTQDAELIDLLCEFYKRLNLKNLTVHLNSVGDLESRTAYKTALKDYLKPYLTTLSKESQERFEKNPLRILDSKAPEDQEIVQKAPSILNFLNQPSETHFQKLLELLKVLKIPYFVNDKLVRGLDYYTHTVFEVTSEDTGASFALGGGGRYDSLLESFGGPKLPGVGFGSGIERVLQVMEAQKCFFPKQKSPFLYLVPLDESAQPYALSLCSELRHRSIPVEIELSSRKLQKSLQHATKLNATFFLVIGEEELKTKEAHLKDLAQHQEKKVSLENFPKFLQELWLTHQTYQKSFSYDL